VRGRETEKQREMYVRYVQKGKISPATTLPTFSGAVDHMMCHDLGVQSTLSTFWRFRASRKSSSRAQG